MPETEYVPCTQQSRPPDSWERVRLALALIFGVLLPALALGLELGVQMFSGMFFEVVPTPIHAVLIGGVAFANFFCWRLRTYNLPGDVRKASWLNGLAVATAGYYSVLFLPILPLGVVGIVVYGLGLLVLSPVLGLVVALCWRVWLKRRSSGLSGFWWGLVVGLALLTGAEIPSTLTRYCLREAACNQPARASRGLDLLRRFGSRKVMLWACYEDSSPTDLLGRLVVGREPLPADRARELYYRTTGRSFVDELPPKALRSRVFDDDWGWEEGQALKKYLELDSSRLDGSVDAEARLAYVEWTLVFRNRGGGQQEARAQIGMPPGAVVSRATLWVKGEEKEAAFGGRAEVTQAYESVVRKARDPLLVTTCGPQRVLVQCFPVPPKGEMKIRLGLTMQLQTRSPQLASLTMPHLIETNFATTKLKHEIWLEAHGELSSAGLTSGEKLRASLSDAQLNNMEVTASARPEVTRVWCSDKRGQGFVQQDLEQRQVPAAPVLAVLDTSQSLKGHLEEIRSALAPLGNVTLMFATDRGLEATDSPEFLGGVDNLPALLQAWDLAAAQEGATVLWIHGPQPLPLSSAEGLRQRLERSPGKPALLEVQLGHGPHRMVEALDGLPLVSLPGLAQIPAPGTRWEFRRQHLARQPEGQVTSDHLARLWAAGEAAQLKRGEAQAMAVKYQLVTPVSGAVVLETREQFEKAGLHQVPEGSVPTIPEPETWLLLTLGSGALLMLRGRRA